MPISSPEKADVVPIGKTQLSEGRTSHDEVSKADTDAKIFSVGNGVSAPEVITQFRPVLTDQARKARSQGTVLLSATINDVGRATNVQVVRGLGMGLDRKRA